MFLFLVDNEIFNFWGNSVGDIFVEATIEKLNLPKDKVKVLFFPLLKNKPEHCLVSGDVLTEQIKEVSQVENVLEDGTVEVSTVESFKNGASHTGIVFFENGFTIKPC